MNAPSALQLGMGHGKYLPACTAPDDFSFLFLVGARKLMKEPANAERCMLGLRNSWNDFQS